MRIPAASVNGYLMITVLSWGLNFVAIKEVYKEIEPPALSLLRFAVMWISLAVICLARRVPLTPPKSDAVKLLYLGFASMGVYMVLFLEGMRGSAATEGAILLQVSPIATAILAAAFRQERFSVGSLFGALVALGGTALIVYAPGHGPGNKIVSNLLVLASAITWAYSVVLMRPLLARHSPLAVLTWSMPGGLPVMVLYGLNSAGSQAWGSVSLYGWSMFFHFAVVSGVVAFLCFYQGVRQVGPSAATLYQFLVPAAAVLFSFWLQGLPPTPYQIVGLAVVLSGVALALRARSRDSRALGAAVEPA